jgi:hypothetical protein
VTAHPISPLAGFDGRLVLVRVCVGMTNEVCCSVTGRSTPLSSTRSSSCTSHTQQTEPIPTKTQGVYLGLLLVILAVALRRKLLQPGTGSSSRRTAPVAGIGGGDDLNAPLLALSDDDGDVEGEEEEEDDGDGEASS